MCVWYVLSAGPCADPRFPETITFRANGPDNQAGTLEVELVERNPVTGEKVRRQSKTR